MITKAEAEKRRADARRRRHEQMNKYLGYRVGQAIKKYKKETGSTNQELAELFECNPQTVTKWCGTNNDMRLDSFLTVVRALELDIHELFKGTEWEGC